MAFVTMTHGLKEGGKVSSGKLSDGNLSRIGLDCFSLCLNCDHVLFSYLQMCSNDPFCTLMKWTSLSQPVSKVLCYCKFSRALFPLKRLSCLSLMSIPSRCLLAAECPQTCQSKTDLIMFSIKSVT
jgi:hypothetical protein